MAAVCMAQRQHQGLGYCQHRFQPDSESFFSSVRLPVSLRIPSQPPSMLTLLLSHSARQTRRVCLCACPDAFLSVESSVVEASRNTTRSWWWWYRAGTSLFWSREKSLLFRRVLQAETRNSWNFQAETRNFLLESQADCALLPQHVGRVRRSLHAI